MANAPVPAVILLVDDDVLGRSSEASILRDAGYEVREAGTGEQALALLEAGVPDLAILAQPLPDMDVQLLRQRLAPGADAAELPVLFITGESNGGDELAPATRLDAEPSLPRPVSAPALLAVARAMIQSGRLWRGFAEARREVELRYRAMFDAMQEGFALHEVVCDERGTPVDYRFLEVNPAFERLTNLRRDEIVGKCVRDVVPTVEHFWIEQYGRVAVSGEPAHLEHRSAALGRWYEAFAYCTRPGQFAAIHRHHGAQAGRARARAHGPAARDAEREHPAARPARRGCGLLPARLRVRGSRHSRARGG
jgi:CheY-like chemotaxis protein